MLCVQEVGPEILVAKIVEIYLDSATLESVEITICLTTKV